MNQRRIDDLRLRRPDENSEPARVDLEADIVAYVDRPRCRLFLEEGVVRFENTNVIVRTKSTSEVSREHLGPLSITFATRGRRICMLDGRRMAVDEDSYLVSNLGQHVAESSEGDEGAESILAGFWPGFAEDVLRSLVTPADQLLDNASAPRFQPVEFFPQLYPRDDLVSPLLEELACVIEAGGVQRGWLEEWNHRVLVRLLQAHRRIGEQIQVLPGARASTRAEYYRRLNRARDFMESCLEAPLDLRQISGEAFMSPHHFLRLFKHVFKETPHQYLTRRRIERAQRLLIQTDLPVTEICYQVGFESLGSFSWLFRKRVGQSPDQYRRERRVRRFVR